MLTIGYEEDAELDFILGSSFQDKLIVSTRFGSIRPEIIPLIVTFTSNPDVNKRYFI